MKQRPRIYYTAAQKALMWNRWQKGDSLQQIAHYLWAFLRLSAINQNFEYLLRISSNYAVASSLLSLIKRCISAR